MAGSGNPLPADPVDAMLNKVIHFPDGLSFERRAAMTDLRRDSEEARILYSCRRGLPPPDSIANGTAEHPTTQDEYVMKIKIQVPRPDGLAQPLPGPSVPTSAELEALKIFRDAKVPFVPHLVTYKLQAQGSAGLLPAGYLTITVMTKLPGETILDLKFWSLPTEESDEIRELFSQQLRAIWNLRVAPYDCALRNILWDRASRQCSIVDFEHWRPCERPADPFPSDQMKKELQRWGVVRRPPPPTWAQEWGLLK